MLIDMSLISAKIEKAEHTFNLHAPPGVAGN
jgi:hypothetical protein